MPDLLLAAALSALAFVVFLGVTKNGFLLLDDERVITGNWHLDSGITPVSVRWAFTTTYFGNWMPLTWLSHLVDVELFGRRPGGHHATSAVLHAVAAALLFLLLRAMTGARWRAWCVAALFAAHPLHVEAVAWAAARRDVLSGLWWFLTLGAYLGYVRRPGAGRYAAVVGSYAAALMTKPMVVTLPFVLFLLDYWPLQRLRRRRVIAEKLPLLALAGILGLVTYGAQRQAGAVTDEPHLSLTARSANAVVAAGSYLLDTLWPAGLSIFYPHPGEAVASPRALLAAAALGTLTIAAVAAARRRPYLPVGWFWFAVTLVPVSGLMQFGSHARADRFTYIPLVGVFLALCWAAGERAASGVRLRGAVAFGSVLALTALLPMSRAQVGRWRDDLTVFGHAIAADPRNWMAHTLLGNALVAKGDAAAAVEHFRLALQARPNFSTACTGLARAAALLGEAVPSSARCAETLWRSPSDAGSLFSQGNQLARSGRKEEAIARYRQALLLDPSSAAVRNNLGNTLAEVGRPEEALSSYRAAIELQPEFQPSYRNLAVELVNQGRTPEALSLLRETLRTRPHLVEVHLILGQVLMATGDRRGAIASFRETLRLDSANQAAAEALRAAGDR